MNNLSYEEAESVIEDVVRIKSYLWQKNYIAEEDIAQELRVKCWQLLKKFDPARGKTLKTFLNSCTQNFLRNLMRDKFSKFNPPCRKECPHYDCFGNPTPEAANCPTYVKYYKLYQSKVNLRSPVSIGTIVNIDENLHPATNDDVYYLDLHIREIIKLSFPADHKKMLFYYTSLISRK